MPTSNLESGKHKKYVEEKLYKLMQTLIKEQGGSIDHIFYFPW